MRILARLADVPGAGRPGPRRVRRAGSQRPCAPAATRSSWPCSTGARGGKRRYLELRRKVRAADRPDVVWAHFLVPSGLIASSVDAPLVVTAHGRDVRNIGAIPGIAALTRRVVERATTVIAVSDYLRRELELKLPEARGKTEVVDSGVDTRAVRAGASRRSSSSRRPIVAIGGPDRAQERRAARRRVRDARPGQPHLRRRRPAAGAARGPRAGSRARPRPPRRGARLPRGGRRRLRALARSSRSGSRSSRRWRRGRRWSRRGSAGRPSSCRPRRGSSSIRSTCRRLPARSRRRRVPVTERGGPRRRGGATTSSFRRSGWSRFCFELLEIGEPELDERADLTPRSRPRGRARAPARSSRAPLPGRHPASGDCRP